MILDKFKLDGRVAVITGAGKGIGRGIALAFSQAGGHVAVAARTASDVEQVAESCRKEGARALAVPCDVTRKEQLQKLVDATLEEFGRIDILVNNAGGSPPCPGLKTSEAFFEGALRFNVTAPFLLTQMAVPEMVRSAGGGAIVNISSRCSDMAQQGFAAYGAGKAALNMVTRNLALEFAPKVRINAISVGGIDTDALKMVLTDEKLSRQLVKNTPMQRPGTVEDIAACALYLASPASAWVTGKIFQIDGGVEAPSITMPVPPL